MPGWGRKRWHASLHRADGSSMPAAKQGTIPRHAMCHAMMMQPAQLVKLNLETKHTHRHRPSFQRLHGKLFVTLAVAITSSAVILAAGANRGEQGRHQHQALQHLHLRIWICWHPAFSVPDSNETAHRLHARGCKSMLPPTCRLDNRAQIQCSPSLPEHIFSLAAIPMLRSSRLSLHCLLSKTP